MTSFGITDMERPVLNSEVTRNTSIYECVQFLKT